ncbi:MAG: LysM peptidoglycan-binding domain-containing protein [Candidatus Promineifilaceae bacterium]
MFTKERLISFAISCLAVFLLTAGSLDIVFADSTHIVQSGETLSRIARDYGVSVQSVAQANNIVNPNYIYVGQVLTIPDGSTTAPAPQPTATTGTTNPPPPATGQTSYTIQAGDTLSRIALRFGVSLADLQRANNIANANYIYVGQVLTIPGAGGGGVTPPPATPVPPAATTAPPQATPVPPVPTPTSAPPTGGTSNYIVQRGDTLAAIARRFGISLGELQSTNNIANPNYIYVGQALTIPGGNNGGGGTTAPTATAVAPTSVAATSVPATTVPQPTTVPATPVPQPTATTAPPPPPVTNTGFGLGGQTQSFANPAKMQEIGMTWVKFQHKWGSNDSPNAVAARISSAHAQGMKVLLSMPGVNTYPSSIDFAGYVNFVRGVAALPDPPDAIEIWNEMNIDFEWPAGTISPSQYVDEMLRPAYQAIKAANPNVMVISGAPAPTGFDNNTNAWADDRYMAGMAAAGAASYMDCIGVHHNAGATAPSATSGHPGGGHYSWYYQATVDLYYNAFGGSRPVCLTEIGYVTGEDYGGTLPQNFAWANGTSLSEHAQWLGEAVSLSANGGKVQMMIIFNVDFTYYDPNGDPQAGYALIRQNGSCPACDPIKTAMGR